VGASVSLEPDFAIEDVARDILNRKIRLEAD